MKVKEVGKRSSLTLVNNPEPYVPVPIDQTKTVLILRYGSLCEALDAWCDASLEEDQEIFTRDELAFLARRWIEREYY